MCSTARSVLVATLVSMLALGSAEADEDVVKETTYGPVKGVLREHEDSIFMEHYLGIPYASPPLGDLRWRPPQPHPGWADEDSPLDATDFRAFCPQIANSTGNVSFVGDEDCLHLNIYVPSINYASSDTPLAVFFWIHGGAYKFGNSNFYDSRFAWHSDTILVTINYRLGALGFLSTGDSHSRGNYGMMDMVAALNWVKENIEYFGGDKDRITIGGESAGSTAVQLLGLSDTIDTSAENKLFHRIIGQSGSPFSDFAFLTNPEPQAKIVMTSLSCPVYSNLVGMECMRSKSVEAITTAASLHIWGPVVDDDLFTERPGKLLAKEANVARLRERYDYLFGVNSFDSGALYQNVNMINDSNSFLSFLEIHFSSFVDSEKIAEAVFLNYVDWTTELQTDEDEWKRLAINATRDSLMLATSLNYSSIASSKEGFDSNVYYYLYTPRPSEAIANTRWAYPPASQFDWVTGCRHGEELPYVFGVPLSTEGSTDAEKDVSLQMMRYWGNFIRTGDPNSGLEVATSWPNYNETASNFMILGQTDKNSTNVTRVDQHLETNKVVFWVKEIPLYEEGDGRDDWNFVPELNSTEPVETVVETNLGKVKGLHLQREGYSLDRFMRIPFAAPPEGLLRFKPPQPHPGWEGVRDCSDRSWLKQWLDICPQRNVRGNGNFGRENCLYLNVWVPGGVATPKEQPLPVMVWMYGGGNNIGTSTGFTFFYDMEMLVTQGAVIGVTLNYRLNSLGFLSTGDENLPGNMGLFDQAMALQWVQDNIANFGGDPSKVTIFGESAGGADVSLHMLSPVSKDLFLRGISESGCVPATWTYGTNPLAQAETLARRLDCPTEDTKMLVACLRDKPLKQLISESVGIGWGAVIDGYFVPEDPKYMLNASMDKDYIMGQNSMEGHSTMSALFPKLNMNPDNPRSDMDRDDIRRAARIFAGSSTPGHVTEAVAYKFIDWEEPETAYLWPRLAVTYMATEWTFGIGSYVAANVRAESNGTGRTYLYIFGENSRVRRFPYWVEANHLREMVYTFGHPFEDTGMAQRFNDSDRMLSKAMMTYWTNFAWSGDPSYPNRVDIPVDWPAYKPDNKYSIFFNTSMSENSEQYVRRNYRGDIMHMWREILYKFWDLPLEECPASKAVKKPVESPVASITRESPVFFADCPDQPFVRNTVGGCVEGYGYDWEGNIVERYLGIPYADPPVGDLRFANPVAKATWDGILPVKNFSKICPQAPFLDATMDEDCLYLSAYVPQKNSSAPLAVIVWLHGGGNQVGDGMGSYEGDALAAVGDVIVVTVNYRLGSLGFLTTDDSAASGNYGLMDQNLAITWVKDNIANFGGDPDRITIAGQSAGAEDAHYQTLSPLTVPLGITRAVLESPAMMPDDDMKQLDSALRLGEQASCDTASGNQVLVACLRSLDVADLISAQQKTLLGFYPTVDGVFLPDHPRTLAEDRNRARTWNYLMGANDGDGSVGWTTARSVDDEAGYHEYVHNRFHEAYGWRTSSIDDHYAHYEDPVFFGDDQKIQKSLVQLFGDEMFIFSTHKLAIDYSDLGSNVFFYYFTYADPSSIIFPEWIGAPHSSEVPLVLGRVLSDATKSDDVKQLSRNMIEYWSNFAKTGDPNKNDESGSSLALWSKFLSASSERQYVLLDTGNVTEDTKNLRPADDAFWNDYMPRQSVYCEVPPEPTTSPPAPPTPQDPDTPSASTTHGVVLGKRAQSEHFDVHAFLGIPYAKAPLEDLRFAKPSPITAWSSPLETKTPKPPCLQLDKANNVIGSEDCLYLDVFLPVGVLGTDANVMPVMVWIQGDANGQVGHLGGSFWSGGGSPGWDNAHDTIDPSYLAHFGNVMIVRPNFRLGAMGFLTTGDDVMGGNYGFEDLQAVIQWTAENAANFGANPETLTVIGQGSGAALSELLGVILPSSHHVKRVISQSGSAFSPWAFCADDSTCGETAIQVASSVGCQGDSENIRECLRTVAGDDIVRSVPYVTFGSGGKDQEYNGFGTWRLRKDGEVIPTEDLGDLFASADFDYVTGTTSHEFFDYLEAADFESGNNTLKSAVFDTHRFLHGSAVDEWPDEAYSVLLHSYTPWTDPTNEELLREASTKYYGDLLFAAASSNSLLQITKLNHATSFQYVLTRSLNVTSSAELPSWVGGRHGDDVIYQFGLPILSPEDFAEEDRKFSHAVMSHWANFAWSGDPNTAFSRKNWRPHGAEAYYNELGTDGRYILRIPREYNVEKNALWNEVVPLFSPVPQPLTSTAALTTTTLEHTTISTEPTKKTTEKHEECVEVALIAQGLGLDLTPEEADTAIYVMFSVCLVLGVALILLISAWVVKAGKPKKERADPTAHLNGSFSSAGVPDDDEEKVTIAL